MRDRRFITCGLLILAAVVAAGPEESLAARRIPSYAVISKAHRSALDLYRDKGNAAAAVRILEEKGVRKILASKPKGMPGDQYVALINDYGYFLSRTDDRYPEAVAVFAIVSRLDPDREAAYLNLGDVYSRISGKSGKPEDAKFADAAYRKYLETVRRKGKKILLPARVVDAVYGSKGKTACQFIADLITAERMDDWERFFDPEKPVDGYDRGDGPDIFERLHVSKERLSEEFLRRNWEISRLERDIDGNEDLRFSAVDGTMRCESNFFFRKSRENTFEPLEAVNQEDAISGDGASLCIARRLRFFRFNGKNHIVHVDHQPFAGGTTWTVFATEGGTLSRVCTLEASLGKPRVTKACSEPICEIVAERAPAVLHAVASEELLRGVETELQDYGPLEPHKKTERWGTYYHFRQKAPRGRDSYLKIPLYSVDMDNDGKNEIYSKWRSTGAGLLLAYDILKRDDGEFRVVDAETEWGRAAPSGERNPLDDSYALFGPGEDFLFERAGGKIYLVTARRSDRGHRLDIYLLVRGKTLEIGTVEASYERTLSLLQ